MDVISCKTWTQAITNSDDGLRQSILSGRSDANIRFEDLRTFLLSLGFVERIRGSHHIFRMQGIRERLNIQREGSHAKPSPIRCARSGRLS